VSKLLLEIEIAPSGSTDQLPEIRELKPGVTARKNAIFGTRPELGRMYRLC
jgi:hypothetical protein